MKRIAENSNRNSNCDKNEKEGFVEAYEDFPEPRS